MQWESMWRKNLIENFPFLVRYKTDHRQGLYVFYNFVSIIYTSFVLYSQLKNENTKGKVQLT